MSGLSLLAALSRPVGPSPDLVGICLDAVSVEGGRLAVALINQSDPDKLAGALAAARGALADAEARQDALLDALSLASSADTERELTRLVRAWPQDKRGDLAGYAVELGLFVIERRPSRRALQMACRALKLGKIHLPSIAEVMDALAAAEGKVLAASKQLGALPDRIARAEEVLAAAKPVRVIQSVVTERTP